MAEKGRTTEVFVQMLGVGLPTKGKIFIDLAIAGALIGIGFYLNSKLCPDFVTVTEWYKNSEGKDKMKTIIKFSE